MNSLLKGLKVQDVKVSELQMNPQNVREDIRFDHIEPDAKTCGYIRKPLVANLDKVLYQGHCRLACATKLGFESVPVIFIDDTKLSDEEKLELLLDHSAERPLSKSEAFTAFSRWVNLGYGEKAAFRKCRAILDLAFGPVSPEKLAIAKAVADSQHESSENAIEEAAFAKHRGTVQNMYKLAKLPEEIQSLYMEFWRNGKSDLTTQDVKSLAKTQDEMLAKQATNPDLTIDAIEAEVVAQANALAQANRESKEDKSTNPKMRKRADIEAMVSNPKVDAQIRKGLQWVLGSLTNEELLK
jgi:ParB-like chromosome segregation protein Spo0J